MGIYPQWTEFVKIMFDPHGNKTMSLWARKDVQRAFGMLHARWGVVCGAAMMWELETLWQLMTCCVILHNMIVEYEDEGAARANGFEKLSVQVRPRIKMQSILWTFWKCIGIFEIKICMGSYSVILWSIYEPTMETKDFNIWIVRLKSILCLNYAFFAMNKCYLCVISSMCMDWRFWYEESGCVVV